MVDIDIYIELKKYRVEVICDDRVIFDRGIATEHKALTAKVIKI